MIPTLFFYASLVNDVRTLIANHDLAAAERQVRAAESRGGVTPEVAAAFSWLARGALDAKNVLQRLVGIISVFFGGRRLEWRKNRVRFQGLTAAAE